MNEVQTRELIASKRDACPLVPLQYAETKGLVEKVEHVKKEAAIFLELGTDLPPNAVSFRQLINLSSAVVTMFLLLLEGVVDGSLGAFYIDLPRNDAGDSRYKRVVLALARRFSGVADATDVKLCDKNVVPSRYFHRIQLEDVNAALLRVQGQVREGLFDKKFGPSAKKKTKTLTAKPARVVEPEIPVLPPLEEFLADNSNRDCIHVVAIPEAEEESEEDDNGEVDRVLTDANVAIPRDENIPNVLNKVTTTMAVCTNADGACVGYLVRFLVHDERWNPGQLVGRFMSEAHTRTSPVAATLHYSDPRPHLIMWTGTSHPAHKMSRERWAKCANDMLGTSPDFDGAKRQIGNQDRPDEFDSPHNPFNVCTLSDAVERARQAGAVINFSTGDFLKGSTAEWPPEMMGKVCQLLPEECFWDHATYVGICNRFLPFSGPHRVRPEIVSYLNDSVLPLQSEIIARMPRYDGVRTNNELILMAMDANELCKDISKFEIGTTAYREAMARATAIQMSQFKMIMTTQPAALVHRNLSEVTRAMIIWLHEWSREGDAITTHVERYDPELSLFANALIKDLFIAEKTGRIIQPIIQLKLRALFCVYCLRAGQLLFNMLVYGDFGGGKSFSTVSFLNKNMIRDTFTQMDRFTSASGQTDQHVYDAIVGVHEAQEEFVDAKEAKKKRNEVNIKKACMTDGVTRVSRAERKTIPGIGSVMVNSLSTQQSDKAEVWCSNTEPDPKVLGSRFHSHLMQTPGMDAHYRNYKVNENEKAKFRDRFRKTQFLTFSIRKAMTVLAIPCRDVSMDIFDDISNKMIDILGAWGKLPREYIRKMDNLRWMAQQLTIERAIMLTWNIEGAPHYGKPFEVEQLKDAAPHLWVNSEITLLAWTLLSSDWVRSEFGDVLRLLFKKATNKEYDPNVSMYDLYQGDHHKEISFKSDRNYKHDPTIDGKLNRTYTDLNMLEINAKHAEIAASIANDPSIHLAQSDILALFQTMSRESFVPREKNRYGYRRKIFADELAQNHRGKRAVMRILTASETQNVVMCIKNEVVDTVYYDICRRSQGLEPYRYINLQLAKSIDMFQSVRADELIMIYRFSDIEFDYAGPDTLSQVATLIRTTRQLSTEQETRLRSAFFDDNPPNLKLEDQVILLWGLELGWIRERGDTENQCVKVPIIRDNVAFPHFATAADLPELDTEQIPVVDVTSKNRLCFSPAAIPLFDKEIIVDAFVQATLCKTTVPGKRLLGWMDDRDISKLRTVRFSREFIDERVDLFDDSSSDAAISRHEGIGFQRHQFIERSGQAFMSEIQERPNEISSSMEVVRDLDRHAATLHYKRCGLDLNTLVVHDTDIYKGRVGRVNYPDDIINEKEATRRANWAPNSVAPNSRILSQSTGSLHLKNGQ